MQWKENLSDLYESLHVKVIYNYDEDSLFFRSLLDKTMAVMGETHEKGKISEERVMSSFCVNMIGQSEHRKLIIYEKLGIKRVTILTY